jgi:hypothetical protein
VERRTGSTRNGQLGISGAGLDAFASVAGDGEVVGCSVRSVDDQLVALAIEGWLPVRELALSDGVVVRNAVVGPAGVAVVVASPPVWTFSEVHAADRQAATVADLLRLKRTDVMAIVCLLGSQEPPRAWHDADSMATVVGDARLAPWLSSLPAVVSIDQLERIRAAVAARALEAWERQPTRLIPRHG